MQPLDLKNLDIPSIVKLLNSSGDYQQQLFKQSFEAKLKVLGNVVHFRGLIEFSNVCEKDCLYCGIRKSNPNFNRYNLNDDQIISAAKFAWENHYGSIVLQSGELSHPDFILRIESLIKKIKKLSNYELGITISLGEQSEETYRRWFDAGAHRYLLRIETSDPKLYNKIHPADDKHSHANRIKCLEIIKKTGYQTGTGVMIGLPFQTMENLAEDLLFMKNFGVDMVGMGPYIEHTHTPLYSYSKNLLPLNERFFLTLKMIAILRLMMPTINIASATALQSINKFGREKALQAGANIIMPNITPGSYRDDYSLYDNKPCTDENAEDCLSCMEKRVQMVNHQVGIDEWGDSKYYLERTKTY